MKVRVAATLATLLLALPVVRGDEKSPPAPKGEEVRRELLSLQGTWKLESLQEGKKGVVKPVPDRTLFVGGEIFLVREGERIIQGGLLRLMPGRTPKGINAAVRSGDNEGNTMLGVYELKDDTLRVCFDPEGDERPKELTAKAGSPLMVAVYKRVKHPDQTVDIIGRYKCESFSTDGRKQTSTAEIERHGDAYLIRWSLAGMPAYVGVGIRKADRLSVAWGNRGTVGISVYEIQKGPKLLGTYTEVGGIGIIAKEQLTPDTGRKEVRADR